MQDFLDDLENELKDEKMFSSEIFNTSIDNKKVQNNNQNQDKENIKKPEIKKENNFIKNNNLIRKDNYLVKTDNQGEREYRWKFISTFPETKFYLPTLRQWYTRFIPIWWNNETWAKNMWMCQFDDDIIIIDSWVQFADPDMYWVNYAIPDISFLTKYKKNIKWILLTHAHLDHIGSLKHVLPALGMPVLYWTKLTIWLAKKSIEEAGLMDVATFVVVDAGMWEKIKIWKFMVEFFKVNHSIPDCAWIYIESPWWAKFVHTWDFKIDFTPTIDTPADLWRISSIWSRWITMLLSDSTWSTRKGFSVSEKEVWRTLEKIVKNHHRGRLIIAAFSSWISRVQQLIDICEIHWKTIFLSWRSMLENVAIAKELGYLNIKPGIMKKMTPKTTSWILPHNQVIITTGSQWEEFSALSRMSEWTHSSIEIIKWDTIVFSSSTVPWNEKSVVSIINKLIKLWANVITKDDREVHTWWHAFQEEQKIMLKLVKPRYFMPVFWDLYYRTVHKNTALTVWLKEENVLLLDNWNIIDFAPNGTVFRSKIKVPIQEIIIDWHWMWTITSHVIKARETMMNAWVLVVVFRVDKRTNTVFWNLKLETRGLVYLDEVRYIHRLVIKKSKDVYENTIKDVPDIEEKDLVKIIKTDLEKFLLQKIDREPMIIPIIIKV